MPSIKKTNINASFFPSEPEFDEDERVENTTAGSSSQAPPPSTSRPRRGPRFPSFGDGAAAAAASRPPSVAASDTVVPSTQPSRRPSLDEEDEQGTSAEKMKRKVILVHFDDDDPEDPMNFSKSRKWVLTALLCSMTMSIGLSTSAYSNTIAGMTEEYGVSQVAGQVGMFTFNAACAIAPLFLAPLCELIGRREVYLTAYGCFVVVFLMLALGKNIGTQIVGRLLSGLFGCCGTILVGGTLSDIWKTKDRSTPMSVFTFAAITGTIMAPLYCGYITASIGWRWVEWIHMALNGMLFILELFFLKETRGAKILMDRAKALRKESGDTRYRAPAELESQSVRDILKTSLTRAIKLLVKKPVLLAFGFWIALAWGITFLFLSVIPITFTENHGWSEGNSGLPYIALIIGCMIGFATDQWSLRKYNKVAEDNGGEPIPEYRLWGALFFTWMLPVGLFIYSWTQFGFIHWIAPMIALVLIIVGIYHIFLSVYNYTADSYGELSSSAIAGHGFMRNMFGAVTPLFGSQMFHGMGSQWAGLLLALITLLLAPLPFILFKYGARIRAKSPYASATTAADPKDHSPNEKEVAAKVGQV